MTIPETILDQLGGGFVRMTGAKQFVAFGATDRHYGGEEPVDNGLSFRLGRNPKSVSHVTIELTPADTYTVRFLRVRGVKVTTLAEHEDVYADMFHELIRNETGLETRFPNIRLVKEA
tara:strand:+ start:1108 stop:1461 length:354 start_codon:yes stop_codon:yes gene_type:complete